MKAIPLALVVGTFLAQAVWAQQFTPPALPSGAKGTGESAEGEILKVYSMEDQGATFRAYVVNYKGKEVVIGDSLATTTKNVGDKIKFIVARVELPLRGTQIKTMSFQILGATLPKKQ